MKVTVIFADRTVYVDGVHRQVVLPAFDPNWRALQWSGDEGNIEVYRGDGIYLANPALLAPFLKAWEDAAPKPSPTGKTATQVEEM